MATCTSAPNANVYLLSTTTTDPPVFQECTPQNADELRFSIRVSRNGEYLTVGLSD